MRFLAAAHFGSGFARVRFGLAFLRRFIATTSIFPMDLSARSIN